MGENIDTRAGGPGCSAPYADRIGPNYNFLRRHGTEGSQSVYAHMKVEGPPAAPARPAIEVPAMPPTPGPVAWVAAPDEVKAGRGVMAFWSSGANVL